MILFSRSTLRSLALASTTLGAAAVLSVTGCSDIPEVPLDDEAADLDNGDGDGDGDEPMPKDDIDVDNLGGSGNGNGNGNGNNNGSSECGNGEFEVGELCDDGNRKNNDGCSRNCDEVDEDFLCIIPGEACERVVTCGNGILEGTEPCDDGNTEAGDGCSEDCKTVEDGFSCVKPGEACVPVPECGNGIRERGEQCDDADDPPEAGDGCDESCQEEDPNSWFCPPGDDCIPLQCGDGNRTPDEECDDGESVPDNGDGCDSNCQVETGWRCGSSGCREICGDGIMLGSEECDDGDLDSGDGCSSACKEEPFYTCPGVAGDCTYDIVCGDGCVDPGEVCDPGNLSNDCGEADSDCTSVAEDPARACQEFNIAVDPGVCGDGVVNLNEECDSDCGVGCDINGCTACEVDDGWSCPGPGYCVRIPECGDGLIQLGEECDPGPISIAGCDDMSCLINTGYYCEGEPSTCDPSECGDGFVAKDEQCDDGPGTVGSPGTAVGGDGCSATCTVETGWVCPPGLDCQPICGNGTLEPGEECEETSAGCSNCFITPGYDCDVNGQNCALTTCGAANVGTPVVERGEGCDDGNDIAGDGCSPTCQVEPSFTHNSNGTPTNTSPTCGDGFKLVSEGCDDGNTTDGDGCSSTCQEETGWTCTEDPVDFDGDFPTIDFKVTYRDFFPSGMPGGHPHFKDNDNSSDSPQIPSSGSDWGIPGEICNLTNYDTGSIDKNHCGLLDTNGKPRGFSSSTTIPTPTGMSADIPTLFSLWYADTPNTTVLNHRGEVITTYIDPGLTASPTTPITDTLTLTHTSNGHYFYDSGASQLFPLDSRGTGINPTRSHNYDFTTELRYFFQYQGGEELVFRGDDDVFVYINGRLAIDVGGIHCAHRGRITLGDEDSSCTPLQENLSDCTFPYSSYSSCQPSAAELAAGKDDRFGLVQGGVYEIALFHAERNPTGSNFRLDLQGFLAPRSTCQTTCGDGIRAGNEICDTNSGLSSGYNVCLNDCTINFCGDGVLQGSDEYCDDAVKVTYQADGGGCGFDCEQAPYCGDGIVQAFAGEVCDDTVNDGSYGSCSSDCTGFGGYCGDGMVQSPEEDCDDAMKVDYQEDGMGCGFDCQMAPFCGDGVRNGPETCEPPGTVECDSMCQIQPFCGDGILSPGEDCDYGEFNVPPMSVEYQGCTTDCEAGPDCGDDVIQAGNGEECDDGDLNSSASNPTYDSCTDACLLGPRCGDGVAQAGAEECDNGFNEDTYAYGPDACGPGCMNVPFCGDGVVDPAIEQCDDGMANNDTAYDGCTTTCLWGPYCGDGVQNGDEECDDPDGNVAYSPDGMGCSFDCKTNVPFCGDGIRNGPEECDEGVENNTGGYEGCKADCTLGPYCGDGKVQSGQGEQCDDGPTGSLSCLQNCRNRSVVQ